MYFAPILDPMYKFIWTKRICNKSYSSTFACTYNYIHTYGTVGCCYCCASYMQMKTKSAPISNFGENRTKSQAISLCVSVCVLNIWQFFCEINCKNLHSHSCSNATAFSERNWNRRANPKKDSFTHSTGKLRKLIEESMIIRRMLDDSPNSLNIITLFV